MSSIVRKSTRIKNQVFKIDSARVVALLVDFFGISPEKPSFEDRKLFERILKLMPRPKLAEPMEPEVMVDEVEEEEVEEISKENKHKRPEVEVVECPIPFKLPQNTTQPNTSNTDSIDPPSPSGSAYSCGDGGGFSPEPENIPYGEESLENLQISTNLPLQSPETENPNLSVVSQRKRGRPRKDSKPKSKRGRLRKSENLVSNLIDSTLTNPSGGEQSVEVQPKPKRGRPRKSENLEPLHNNRPVDSGDQFEEVQQQSTRKPDDDLLENLPENSSTLNISSCDNDQAQAESQSPELPLEPHQPLKRKYHRTKPIKPRPPRPPVDPKLSVTYCPRDSSSDDELEDRYCQDPTDQEYVPQEPVLFPKDRTIAEERMEQAYRYWTKQSMDLSVPLKVVDLTIRDTKKHKLRYGWRTVASRFREITSDNTLYRYHARLLAGNQRVSVERIGELTYKRFQEAVARGEVLHDKHIQDIAMQVKADIDPEGRLKNFKASDSWLTRFKQDHGIKLKEMYPLKVLYPRVEGSRLWTKEQKMKANASTEKPTKSKSKPETNPNPQLESNSLQFQNVQTSHNTMNHSQMDSSSQVIMQPDYGQMGQQYVIQSAAVPIEPNQPLRFDSTTTSDLNNQFGLPPMPYQQQQQAQSNLIAYHYSSQHQQQHQQNTQDLFYQILNQDHHQV